MRGKTDGEIVTTTTNVGAVGIEEVRRVETETDPAIGRTKTRRDVAKEKEEMADIGVIDVRGERVIIAIVSAMTGTGVARGTSQMTTQI